MSPGEAITLGKMHFAYILLVLFVVLPALVLLAFGNSIWGFWCERFELPAYEKTLGFRMERRVWGSPTDSYEALAIGWVDPRSPLAQAGVRPGDLPRMHHGAGDFCSTLRSVSAGQPVQFEVTNLNEQAEGHRTWRVVTMRARPR